MTVTSLPSVPLTALPAFGPPKVLGLDEQTQGLLDELVVQWARKLPRNIERMVYLDAKNTLDDLGVSLPPGLVDRLDVVVGWPEKAVYEVANRIVFERVYSPDGDGGDPFGLRRLLHENRFALEFPQAVVSSLAQSCVFGTATPGRVDEGEPESLVMFHSALWSTGLWDRRRRALRAGLLVSETDSMGRPIELTILTPTESIVCVKGGRWYVEDVIPHRLGRTPMEVFPFRPSLDRPFGRSRIDRAVMSLTNRAVRAGSRLEVHSELFTSMKLILLGAEEEAFRDASGNMVPLWSFFLGRLNTLSKDEDGDVPKLEKIAAESPEPHLAIIRQLASQFSGHTGVPLSSLGIATDNPESAEAKQMAREDIVNDVEKQHVIYGDSLLRLMENAVMIRDRLDSPPDGIMDVELKWRRADRPSLVSIANAGIQQVSAIPALGDTEVGMELVGMTPEQIERATAEIRRREARGNLAALMAAGGGGTPETLEGR